MIDEKNQMKIVYCVNSIRFTGGIQRVTVVKANALAEVAGNEVYIVVTDNKAGSLVHEVSPKVHVIDLDINYHEGDRDRSFIANNFVHHSKRLAHRKVLKRFLVELRPDVVISVGTAEKFMLASMKKRSWKIIREFHCERYYRVKYAQSRINKILGAISNFYEFNFVDKKYDRIVVLTQEDQETNWKGWKNIAVIPNPVSFKCSEPSTLNEKTVSSIGRLHHVKNFSALIRIFGQVVKKHPDWDLKIYGNGEEEGTLQKQIEQSGLHDKVTLMGFTNNIPQVLSRSSVFAFTSLVEGFALVLVEAMECGLPVVSYQCPCGPKDIITEGKNGFLVPVNDVQLMVDRINQLIEDKEMRTKMSEAAKLRAQCFQVEAIVDRWMSLFNEVVHQN